MKIYNQTYLWKSLVLLDEVGENPPSLYEINEILGKHRCFEDFVNAKNLPSDEEFEKLSKILKVDVGTLRENVIKEFEETQEEYRLLLIKLSRDMHIQIASIFNEKDPIFLNDFDIEQVVEIEKDFKRLKDDAVALFSKIGLMNRENNKRKEI